MQRSNHDKLAIFRHRFRGLTDVYGTFDPRTWRGWQVKRPITDRVIVRHLQGRRPLGMYFLIEDRTHVAAVDFDADDAGPPVAFLKRCEHYSVPAYLERSKRRGWHVWLFGSKELLAAKVRLVIQMLLEEIEQPKTEIFPKQDALRPGACKYGNWILLPLWGGLVRQGRTVFVDPHHLHPYPDQWGVLESAGTIDEEQLDELIEVNDLAANQPVGACASNRQGRMRRTFGLPPCMQRMLEQGVTDLQRVSCFRLAVQLKKTGLPESMTVAVLDQWATRNRPRDGKQVIAPAEIREQTRWAYQHSYTAIGCHDPAVLAFRSADCPCVAWNARTASSGSENAAADPRRARRSHS